MPTPAEIINMTASLQNDTNQTIYTDAACLPYLNMALDELQEIFEMNNIPVTNEVSVVMTVPAGTTEIAFVGTTPLLPQNLIEIRKIWESASGINEYVGMSKVEYLPQYLEGVTYTSFMFWAWIDNAIHLLEATGDIDLKLDYIKSIFSTPILISQIDDDLGIKFKNVKSYLGYKTAALCSMYIGENETRATALNMQAEDALFRSLDISLKGKQSMMVRRRPFRAAYKSRINV